jgi:excisionase family DNA binding protein
MTLTLHREPIAAPNADREALRGVEAMTQSGLELRVSAGDQSVELPEALRLVLEQAAHELVRGNQVSLLPLGRMLTTRQAAEMLNVSRPFLIQLLEREEIPYEMVGTHRRVAIEDVLRYRAKRSERRREVLRALSEDADELGIYAD